MVGNDVVDLADPETQAAALHPRFDERVFAAPELARIAASATPGRLRWVLWAAKEAAYKAAKRMEPRIVFSPRRFAVTETGARTARVEHGPRRFEVALELEEDWVHAVATAVVAPRPRSLLVAVSALEEGVEASPRAAGRAVRTLAVAIVARALGLRADRLAVVREGRLPRLTYGSRVLAADVSLSHHGRFAACACVLGVPPGARRSAL
jgi:phosphopantetheinyl transferase (holo-ACP synthase)